METINKEFKYRPFKNKDRKKLCTEMCETFGLGCYSENKFISKLIYNHYFLIFFKRYNFTNVVLDGDKPVGIVVGETHDKPVKNGYKLIRSFYALLLYLTKAGRLYFAYSELVKKTDNSLIKDLGSDYNEMQLLEVKKDYRHYGLGKKLIESYEREVQKSNDKTYYLLTDDYCDVNYYYKHDYKLVNSTHASFCEGDDCEFFLFKKSIV